MGNPTLIAAGRARVLTSANAIASAGSALRTWKVFHSDGSEFDTWLTGELQQAECRFETARPIP